VKGDFYGKEENGEQAIPAADQSVSDDGAGAVQRDAETWGHDDEASGGDRVHHAKCRW
jgi:hypothetical protein